MKDLPFCLNVITENDIRGDCVATLGPSLAILKAWA